MSHQREQRRKPTGKSGVLRVGASKQEFVPIAYGKSKEEIEEFFLNAAMRYGLGQSLGIVGAPSRNEEHDFDYTIQTGRGVEYVDLMEFAPLGKAGGSYDRVPETTDAGPFARLVWEEIIGKAKKYGAKPNHAVHLLMYTTDFRLHLFREVEDLIAFWAHRSPTVFTSIFYIEPLDQTLARLSTLYPRAKEEFASFDARERALTRRISIDLSSAPSDAVPDKDGWMSGPVLGRWSDKEKRFIKENEPPPMKGALTAAERRRKRNRNKRERKKERH